MPKASRILVSTTSIVGSKSLFTITARQLQPSRCLVQQRPTFPTLRAATRNPPAKAMPFYPLSHSLCLGNLNLLLSPKGIISRYVVMSWNIMQCAMRSRFQLPFLLLSKGFPSSTLLHAALYSVRHISVHSSYTFVNVNVTLSIFCFRHSSTQGDASRNKPQQDVLPTSLVQKSARNS